MTAATSGARPAGRRFTLGRAVLVGSAAAAVIVGGVLLIPDRSQPLAEPPPKPAAQLAIDTLPQSRPSAPAPQPVRAADPVPVASGAPPRPAEPTPAGSPAVKIAVDPDAPSPDRRVLGGALVQPLDSPWETVEGSLGCPNAAQGSVMEMLCRLNAQGLTREYQLKLMDQEARRAELLARRAQAEKQRREAETMKPAIQLPPVEGRSPPQPIARSGPTVASVRGQGGSWTATIRLADGTSVPVRAGQELPGGLRVQRIDRDGVVIRSAGGERRLDFTTAAEADAAQLPRLGPDPRPGTGP